MKEICSHEIKIYLSLQYDLASDIKFQCRCNGASKATILRLFQRAIDTKE